MRRLKAFLIAIIAFLPITAAAADSYRVNVEGLACPICAYRVERSLAALDGVESVEADFRTGIAIVTMAEGATLDEAAAKRAIEDTGFSFGGIGEAQPKLQDKAQP
jgi:copper chaperone CopZ